MSLGAVSLGANQLVAICSTIFVLKSCTILKYHVPSLFRGRLMRALFGDAIHTCGVAQAGERLALSPADILNPERMGLPLRVKTLVH